ncbi:MAG: hypothetical protein CME04_15595 [Gemmatimonadaceae bacterium]|nr:hypothetical protein [Gemmatimonadaceae bacterium]
MNRALPPEYREHVAERNASVLRGRGLSGRAVWTGAFLSFFLAAGAPYVDMVMQSTFMAFDFSTPGAIILFLLLIGGLNVFFKVASRGMGRAVGLAVLSVGSYGLYYWPLNNLDPHSPGVQITTFLVASALLNVWQTRRHASLALNRSELVMVYVMLLIVSALCTMGMSQQLLPTLAAFFYYASPENDWLDRLLPHSPTRRVIVDDGHGNRAFFEGVGRTDVGIAYDAWIEPLLWWAVFLLALYVSMVCIAVILRRQWLEHEKLPYPLTRVGLAMVEAESEKGLVNGLFKNGAVWLGCAVPMGLGTLKGLSRYSTSVTALDLDTSLTLFGLLDLSIAPRFSLIGFSYLINTQVAAGIWVFYLVARLERELLNFIGVTSDQVITYGVSNQPLMGYQGGGALLAMVLVGLWVGRQHLRDVFMKALGRAPQVDDSDEIMSYRAAVFGLVGGVLVMTAWLWLMGTPLWVSGLFIVLALLIFIGITRIIAEAGLAALRAPMIAPDLTLMGLGSDLVGAAGGFNLSLAYIWSSDIRVFIMGMAANGLKMIEAMDLRSRRFVLWGIGLAILIGACGSCWTVFHLAHEHGGINVASWGFKGGPNRLFDTAARNLEPAGVYWQGMGFVVGGGMAMTLMMWARHRLTWWPIHPIGFPIGGNDAMMDRVWGNVLIAWAIKVTVLRFGGAAAYRRSQFFFLGLIMGEALCNGTWLVIDYFTGRVGNDIFDLN